MSIDEHEHEIANKIKQLDDDYRKELSKILTVVRQIETRLVGDINSETPGLISDVRELKREVLKVNQALEENRQIKYATFDEVKKLEQEIVVLNRWRWSICGAAMVFGFAAEYVLKILKIT